MTSKRLNRIAIISSVWQYLVNISTFRLCIKIKCRWQLESYEVLTVTSFIYYITAHSHPPLKNASQGNKKASKYLFLYQNIIVCFDTENNLLYVWNHIHWWSCYDTLLNCKGGDIVCDMVSQDALAIVQRLIVLQKVYL